MGIPAVFRASDVYVLTRIIFNYRIKALLKKSLFIHTHVAEKNRLYMMGEVITDWSQVGGPAKEPSPAGK